MYCVYLLFTCSHFFHKISRRSPVVCQHCNLRLLNRDAKKRDTVLRVVCLGRVGLLSLFWFIFHCKCCFNSLCVNEYVFGNVLVFFFTLDYINLFSALYFFFEIFIKLIITLFINIAWILASSAILK